MRRAGPPAEYLALSASGPGPRDERCAQGRACPSPAASLSAKLWDLSQPPAPRSHALQRWDLPREWGPSLVMGALSVVTGWLICLSDLLWVSPSSFLLLHESAVCTELSRLSPRPGGQSWPLPGAPTKGSPAVAEHTATWHQVASKPHGADLALGHAGGGLSSSVLERPTHEGYRVQETPPLDP